MQHEGSVRESFLGPSGDDRDWAAREEDALIALRRAAARDRRGVLCGYGVLLLLFLGLLLAVRVRQSARPPVTLSGVATPLPVLARAATLCRRLGAGDGPLALEAARAAGRAPWWQVECTDGTGGEVARFDWEADSGALAYVSRPGRSAVRGRVMDSAQAVRTARRWLRSLRLGESAPGELPWTLGGVPQRFPCAWLVTWRAPGRRALVHLDARTGALFHAEAWSPRR